MNQTTVKEGHPKGLYLLFLTEMWERFSYYGMRGILILYLTKSIISGGLNIDPGTASLIYGWFAGFVYLAPMIGGWLADKYLGQRLAITIGGITMMFGQFALFAINTYAGLTLGLILLIIGNGFFKPNISVIVGQLYKDGDDRRDSAFSIFYMGINLGALLAPLVIGYVSDQAFSVRNETGEILTYGYKYGFLVSGIGMLLGQVIFNTLAQKYLGNLGKHANNKAIEAARKAESGEVEGEKKPLTKEEKDRITVIMILTSFVIFFWAGFEQAGSSVSLYTDQFINRTVNIDWNILGWNIALDKIPTPYFQSVNPLFIVLLAPLFAIFWNTRMGKKLTTPVKMGLGMILLGTGFLFMIFAISKYGLQTTPDHAIADSSKIALIWLVFMYFFHTVGELCLSPVGLSVVTKLAPVKLASILMAVWLASSGIANILGGFVAAYVEELGAYVIFGAISALVIFLGLGMIALNKWILKKMHGVR